MTSNRNHYADQQATNVALAEGPEGPSAQARPNWLGHTKGSANIDALLLTGSMVVVMGQHRSHKGVRDHIRHLRIEHGLIVNEQQGLFNFGLNAA